MGNNHSTSALESLEIRIYDSFVDLLNSTTQITVFNTNIMDNEKCRLVQQQCITYINEARQEFDKRRNVDTINDKYFNQLIASLYSLPLTDKAYSMDKHRKECIRIIRRLSNYLRKYVLLGQKIYESSQKVDSINNNRHNNNSFFGANSNNPSASDPVIEL